MAVYSAVTLVTFIVFLFLLALILRDGRARMHRLFLVYLVASTGWSLSAFMINSKVSPGQLPYWGALLPVCGLWSVVAYWHFICVFTHRRAVTWVRLGYTFIAALAVLAALGIIPQTLEYLSSGEVNIEYGPWMFFMGVGGAVFTTLSVLYLVQRYRSLRDPLSRNRVTYLLVGVSLLVIFSVRTAVPPFPKYSLDHVGHLANALIITYAIMRYKLLDIKLIVRKGLAYSSVVVFITASYLVMLLALHDFVQNLNSSASIAAILVMAFVMAMLFNPLRTLVQKGVDRLFYRETYEYRQLVLSFARRMSNVIDLDELAEAMLKPIAKAVNATQASLLLPQNSGFSSEYAERLVEGEPIIPIKLDKDSPVVNWLDREDEPLSREMIDIAPEFKGLWQVERDITEGVEIELLVPMKSKGKLVGILALSKKDSGGHYSSDDIELVTTLVHEAAVAIENAQLYAQARERAHIDELTGLYNHRYFHERLDEEISRCSRFGDIFSLLFLDMDLFKMYNDVYGHLAGDEILREIGQYIRGTIRGIDMAFRYGGDEFTIILPQASLEDAHTVAERIRKRIESEMDHKGVALTCSMGIASWPTEGVMREEILQAADAALYHSKQAGRNRISLASDVTHSRATGTRASLEGEPGVLSTIYALAATVDAKDHYTYGHSKKVSRYATEIAEALGFSEERIATIRAAALLHDIGKIGVSDGILLKTNALSADDWESIRAHPKLGVAILKHVGGLSGCLAAIQYHHERWDGSGYPAGLKGENIPLDARILAVADAYDAMTSLRPYREGKLSPEQAMDEIERCAGTQFDPDIARAFIAQKEAQLSNEAKARRSPVETQRRR
jgi:diguanylate cyclase (GGDEF)-like protein/putative nucleotidyltransferase with HDIG domain